MAFLNRLKYYLIGVAIGSLMVFFMFGSRADIKCSYFPNQRVLNDISKKELQFSELASCQFASLENDSTLINKLLTGGKVDFEKSNTKKESCKTYYITYSENDKDISFEVENCSTEVTVLSFDSEMLNKSDCD